MKTDRSCAEILAVLLRHGQWFRSAIELDTYVKDDDIDGETLKAEARRVYARETGKPAPEFE